MEFAALQLDAVGTVDRVDGATRFTEIVLRPTITVTAGSDTERVRRILERTRQACLVFVSLSTAIRLEPGITSLEDSEIRTPFAIEALQTPLA